MDGPAQGGSPLTQAPGGSASRCLLVALSPRMHLSPRAVSTPLWICGGFPDSKTKLLFIYVLNKPWKP